MSHHPFHQPIPFNFSMDTFYVALHHWSHSFGIPTALLHALSYLPPPCLYRQEANQKYFLILPSECSDKVRSPGQMFSLSYKGSPTFPISILCLSHWRWSSQHCLLLSHSDPQLPSTSDERLTLKLIECTWKETLTSLPPTLPHLDKYPSPVWKDRKLTLLNSSLSLLFSMFCPFSYTIFLPSHSFSPCPGFYLTAQSTLLWKSSTSSSMPQVHRLLHPAFALSIKSTSTFWHSKILHSTEPISPFLYFLL